MANTVVKLRKPFQGHRGMVTELRFREPTYRDVMSLGEPGMLVQTADGSKFVQESIGIIDEYAQRLLASEDADPAMLDQLCLADALAIKELVQGFFYSARTEEKAPPDKSPPPS
ncbi:MAG: hypothetical protein JWM36_3249 [Hyphomicrobiales bacterium]|nr:hypothetical protein [Hyphomicrobiales bacterium]